MSATIRSTSNDTEPLSESKSVSKPRTHTWNGVGSPPPESRRLRKESENGVKSFSKYMPVSSRVTSAHSRVQRTLEKSHSSHFAKDDDSNYENSHSESSSLRPSRSTHSHGSDVVPTASAGPSNGNSSSSAQMSSNFGSNLVVFPSSFPKLGHSSQSPSEHKNEPSSSSSSRSNPKPNESLQKDVNLPLGEGTDYVMVPCQMMAEADAVSEVIGTHLLTMREFYFLLRFMDSNLPMCCGAMSLSSLERSRPSASRSTDDLLSPRGTGLHGIPGIPSAEHSNYASVAVDDQSPTPVTAPLMPAAAFVAGGFRVPRSRLQPDPWSRSLKQRISSAFISPQRAKVEFHEREAREFDREQDRCGTSKSERIREENEKIAEECAICLDSAPTVCLPCGHDFCTLIFGSFMYCRCVYGSCVQ